MVANAHGLHIDLADLRRRFPVSLKGATLQQLIAHAGSLNFSSRPLRLELNELAQLQLPCILHWDLNHFVVLKKAGRRSITILDPAVGERRVLLAEVTPHFTGVALEISPNADFQPADQRQRVKLSALTGTVLGLKRSLFQIFAVAVVLECEFAINDFLAQVGGPRMVEKSRHATSSSRLPTGWAMALDCTVESTITRSSPIVEAHPAPPRIHHPSTAPVRRVFNDRRPNNSSTTATAKI